MPWAVAGAAVAAGGSILGGSMSADAQKSAANQQADATRAGLDFQKDIYGNTQRTLAPFINTGTSALYSLASLYGLPGGPGGEGGGAAQTFQNFTQTPAYQFPLQQGLLGANRGLAAAGLTGSGAQAKALTQYGQGYASQNFNNYIGQLAGLAGFGQSSASALGGQGNSAAAGILGGQNLIGGAQAAGTLGAQNSLNKGWGDALAALGRPTNQSDTSFGGSSSAIGQVGTGVSNLWNGYNWNGTPGSSMIANLNQQAANNGNIPL